MTDKKVMQITALVVAERPDSYVGKKGVVNSVIITVQDMEPGNTRCIQPFDYTFTPEEQTKYAGKLQDKQIKLAIRQIEPFSGRLRVKGQILEVLTK